LRSLKSVTRAERLTAKITSRRSATSLAETADQLLGGVAA
jgi:hypothetical protein